MLNPWFSFSFETARQGLQAQSVLVFGLMRLFGAGVPGQVGGHVIKGNGEAVAEVEGDATPVAIERDTRHKEAEKSKEVVEVHGHGPSVARGRDDARVTVERAHKEARKDSKAQKSTKHTQRPPERAPKRSVAARHRVPSAVVGRPNRKGGENFR